METKFQTSFIPKKPAASAIGNVSSVSHKHTTSIFMTIATLLFIVSLAGAGGAYAYKQYLLSAQDTYKQDLATREQQFNTDLIQQLKAENVKIDLAHQILNSHIALSQIFDIIGRMTIETVRFLSLDVTVPSVPTPGSAQSATTDGVKISLQGYGTSFSAVAFQSDVLGQLDQYGLRNIVKNPIISSPALGTNGTVAFGFSAVVDPSSLSYENMIAPSVSSSASSASGQNQATSSSTSASGARSSNGSSNGSPFTTQ